MLWYLSGALSGAVAGWTLAMIAKDAEDQRWRCCLVLATFTLWGVCGMRAAAVL